MKSESSIKSDYNRWHSELSEAGETQSPLEYPWYETVANHIESLTSGRVLEVGCGRGGFAIWLARAKPKLEVTGLDFSDSAIRIAKAAGQAAGTSVEFVQGGAEELPFPDGSFDLVISCECMEHVPHPPVMARELARVLKAGGHFCLTTENYFNGMLMGWAKSWLTRTPFNSGSGIQPRENFFFFWMVQGYLEMAGLSVTSTESCHHQWLLLPRVDPAKLCTDRFQSEWARALAKPFGRHFSFFGIKPGKQL